MTRLSFQKSKEILSKYGVSFCKEKLVQTKEEAVEFAEKIGYPVVVKIFSPEILHITDIGGIRHDIEDREELENACSDLRKLTQKKVDKKIEGFLIQEEIRGAELVVGMKRSKEFGPVIMFGLGGVLVEVIKDISFRVAPFSEKEARKMIKEIKGYKLLKKFRGYPAVDLNKLIDLLMAVSRLSLENDNIKEIDLNPVIANDKEALVVDTSILYEES